MTGDPAGTPPRRSNKGLGVVFAALGLTLLYVAFRYGMLPASLPFELPFALPPMFWLLLLLLGSTGLVVHVARRERARDQARRAAYAQPDHDGTPEVDDEPQIRPYTPEEVEPEPVSIVAPAEDGFVPLAAPAAPAAAAGPTESDDELPDLLNWLKGISASISQWTVEVAEELHSPPVDLLPDEPRHVTTNVAVPKIGSWTDLKARVAIEKYLRTRPWAPPADVAKALGMDIALATRLTDSLRSEGFR